LTSRYTTTGWIIYFSSVMNLLPGAQVVLYNRSPFQPDITTFIKLISEQKVTMLGMSLRWMTELQKEKVVPKDVTDLNSLRLVTSTGIVLSNQLFE
jgi:acetoacetyl-CoA synthetase